MLNADQVISIPLEAGGYPGQIRAVIAPENIAEFETDWHAGDPTRFPARIKAAVTALRDCGYRGSFRISHTDGVLSISKAS